MVCGVLRATFLSSSKAEPGGFPSICINSCQTQEEDSIPINSLGPLQKQRPLCEVDTVLPGGCRHIGVTWEGLGWTWPLSWDKVQSAPFKTRETTSCGTKSQKKKSLVSSQLASCGLCHWSLVSPKCRLYGKGENQRSQQHTKIHHI